MTCHCSIRISWMAITSGIHTTSGEKSRMIKINKVNYYHRHFFIFFVRVIPLPTFCYVMQMNNVDLKIRSQGDK